MARRLTAERAARRLLLVFAVASAAVSLALRVVHRGLYYPGWAVVGAAQTILNLTDPANFDSTVFMPVTREMSRGKRSLLQRFCQKVISGQIVGP